MFFRPRRCLSSPKTTTIERYIERLLDSKMAMTNNIQNSARHLLAYRPPNSMLNAQHSTFESRLLQQFIHPNSPRAYKKWRNFSAFVQTVRKRPYIPFYGRFLGHPDSPIPFWFWKQHLRPSNWNLELKGSLGVCPQSFLAGSYWTRVNITLNTTNRRPYP
jgi:hypothetical protein